jgi:hypothetical protein
MVKMTGGGHKQLSIGGLLLRTDLHTLFDLDLVGIHPKTLFVSVHPKVRAVGYAELEGVPSAQP